MNGIRHMRGLDGIRALSVAAVLIYHLGTTGGRQFLPGGFLGVDVFFVLSGFLITSLLLAEQDKTGTISVRHLLPTPRQAPDARPVRRADRRRRHRQPVPARR